MRMLADFRHWLSRQSGKKRPGVENPGNPGIPGYPMDPGETRQPGANAFAT